jgi:hypothetical protein
MTYRWADDFFKDYRAAKALAAQKYGAFYKDVPEMVGWKAYRNAGAKANSKKDYHLGFMLFGRHVASLKQEVAKRADADLNARQLAINAKDAKMKSKWYIPSAYRKAVTKKATTANFARAAEEKKHIPPGIETEKNSDMVTNFGLVNNDTTGAILLMGSANWNLTINDSWLLGAVHSHLPFYPASAVSRANIFDDKYILSITGRELFGLALFGYRQVVSAYESLGSAFEVSDVKKANGATLQAYQKAMGELTKEKALTAFNDAGFTIAEVGF